jgi:hypothetical protein
MENKGKPLKIFKTTEGEFYVINCRSVEQAIGILLKNQIAVYSHELMEVDEVDHNSFEEIHNALNYKVDINGHECYVDRDKNIPESILDRNGQVVLSVCKICGKGEADLNEECTPKNKLVLPQSLNKIPNRVFSNYNQEKFFLIKIVIQILHKM